MHPILLDWGPLFVPSWHLFVALGAMAAFYAMMSIQTRYYPTVSGSDLRILFAICYLSGLLGSRATEVLVTHEAHSFGEFLQHTFSLGGMVFYGGMILGLVSGWIFCFVKKLDPARILDIAMPAVFLGLAFGRIGCFLNGDDYGIPGPADSFFTVIFPNLGDHTPRYATQLMESFIAFALFFIGLWGQKYDRKAGRIGLALLVLYSVLRFAIEYLRDDPRGFLFFPSLSTSQSLSLLVGIVGIALLLRPRIAPGSSHG